MTIPKLSRALIVYSSSPPMIDYFQRAFQRAGIKSDYMFAGKHLVLSKGHSPDKQVVAQSASVIEKPVFSMIIPGAQEFPERQP
jgi:hypothetical protein